MQSETKFFEKKKIITLSQTYLNMFVIVWNASKKFLVIMYKNSFSRT